MQLELLRSLEASKDASLRRATILKTLKDEGSLLSSIDVYLKDKYQIKEHITKDILNKAQKSLLYSEIEKKSKHKKLYDIKSIEQVDIEGSSIWLTKGNNKPQIEAKLCYLQDRNMFGDKPENSREK